MINNSVSLILLSVSFLFFSCKTQQVSNEKKEELKPIVFDNHFISLVEGRILKRYKNLKEIEPAYKGNNISADVELLNIHRKGQNYHGQFETGDTLRIFFNFTLENTIDLFPNLNQHLPGLKENDVFKAELEEIGGNRGPYAIYLYQLLK